MIVYRAVWRVKEGCSYDEALELFKEFNGPKVARILGAGLLAPTSNTLVFEFEFDSIGACEGVFGEWMTKQGGSEFMTKWFTVCEENSSKEEVWVLL